MSFLMCGKHAPPSKGRGRRGRPPADSRDFGESIAEEHVLRERKAMSRSKTKKRTPNSKNMVDEWG